MTDLGVKDRAAGLLTANGREFAIRRTFSNCYTLWISAKNGRWYPTSITVKSTDRERAKLIIAQTVLRRHAAKTGHGINHAGVPVNANSQN